MFLRFLHRARPRLIVLLALLPGLIAIVFTGIAALGGTATGPSATPSVTGQAAPTASPALPTNGRWLPTNLRVETDALIQDPADSTRLVAGTAQGIWTSADAGKTWQRDMGLPARSDVLALAAGGNPRSLYAADSDGRIFRRAESGKWAAIGPQPAPGSIFSLAVSQASPPVVLAGTSGALYRGEQTAGQWRWKVTARTDQSSFAALVWLPGSAKDALASVFGSAPPALASTDAGRTWHPSSQGLPSTLPAVALIAQRGPPSTIVLSTMGYGVWQLAATKWTEISKGLPERHAMPLTRGAATDRLYAGTMGYGVFTRGATGPWEPVGKGLTGSSYIVLSLAYVGGAHPTLAAGTGNGVYRYEASN